MHIFLQFTYTSYWFEIIQAYSSSRHTDMFSWLKICVSVFPWMSQNMIHTNDIIMNKKWRKKPKSAGYQSKKKKLRETHENFQSTLFKRRKERLAEKSSWVDYWSNQLMYLLSRRKVDYWASHPEQREVMGSTFTKCVPSQNEGCSHLSIRNEGCSYLAISRTWITQTWQSWGPNS